MKAVLKFLLIICLTAASVYVGYRFLSIRADVLLGAAEEEKNLEPVLKTETIPVPEKAQDAYEPAAVAQPPQANVASSASSNEERIVTHVVNHLQTHGSNVMDSRYFADQAACDSAVRTVAAEYRRRGVRDQDMTETAAFPGSKGLVIMFTSQNVLYYIGCAAPPEESWAVYVQFVPQ